MRGERERGRGRKQEEKTTKHDTRQRRAFMQKKQEGIPKPWIVVWGECGLVNV